MLISLGNHVLLLKKKKKHSSNLRWLLKKCNLCQHHLKRIDFPLPWQILKIKLNHRKRKKWEHPWPVVLYRRNELVMAVNQDTSPMVRVSVDCLSYRTGRRDARSATLLPPQESAEHYLKTRKASDEQTFITECASAKTKIHHKLLVLARWQYEQAVLVVILQIIWV